MMIDEAIVMMNVIEHVNHFVFLWLEGVRFFFLFSVLIFVSYTDLRWRKIPNKVVYPAVVIALGFMFINPGPTTALWGALVATLALLIPVFLYGPEKAGIGDAKLALFIGLMLGFPLVFYALLVAFLLASLVVLPGLLSGRLQRNNSIPFAPFLAVGALVVWLV